MEDAKPIGAVIGETVRRLRESAGGSQEEVANAARQCGLTWTRSVVAALEAGRREVETGELLLLPLVLAVAMPDAPRVSVADLIDHPRHGGDPVRVGPDAVILVTDFLRHTLTQPVGTLQNFVADMPLTRESMQRAQETIDRVRPYRRWYPRAPIPVLEQAERDAGREVEMRTARVLGVPAVQVAVLSHRLWRHSMTEERERRLAAGRDGAGGDLRALRGHVTRALLAELWGAISQLDEQEATP